jgi:hypothetical protein
MRCSWLLLLAGLVPAGSYAADQPAPPAASNAAADTVRPGGSDAAGLLTRAMELLRGEVRKLPARPPGSPVAAEEYALRLRLAATAAASDRPGEAYMALHGLPARTPADHHEVERLALLAAAAWRSGESQEAENLAASLLAAVSSGRRLGLQSLLLVDSVTCFGQYRERAVKTVRPGETVEAYVEVLGFHCTQKNPNEYLTALDVGLAFEQEVSQVDRRGEGVTGRQVIQNLPAYSQVRHHTRSPLRDLHLVIRLRIPQELIAGREYLLRVTVSDRNVGGGGEAGHAQPAEGQGGAPSTSQLLVIKVAG